MAQKVGLKINARKTNRMWTSAHYQSACRASGRRCRSVGSIVDEHGGTDADVKARINKTRHAFASLRPVWNSRKISTKLRLFNSNVKSVLLNGSECWKTTQEITKKIRVFIQKCLRIILRIRWPQKISNVEVSNLCEKEDIMVELTRRKVDLAHIEKGHG